MRGFVVTNFETKPAVSEQAVPIPLKGQLQIAVKACGLNFADLLMMQGRYQDTPKPPFSLGMEVCGTVTALGPDTAGPAVGTRIAGFSGAGGLAEYAVLDVERCTPVPVTMTDTVAAGFQIAYGTSHLALSHRARLQPGERLLVLGAAGGVGLTAVEIGKLMGAEVVAVARGGAKLEVARKVGADHTIEASEDLTARLRELGGVDVIYDPVGGEATVAALRALRPEGRLVVIGFASGDVPVLKANHLMVKNQDVLGVYWGGYLTFNATALTHSLETLMKWHTEGRLSPHVSHVLPLEEAAAGFQMLRNRTATGKIVVTI